MALVKYEIYAQRNKLIYQWGLFYSADRLVLLTALMSTTTMSHCYRYEQSDYCLLGV